MVTYLSEDQLRTFLTIGKSVEQWVSYQEENEVGIIKWLRIDKERNNNYRLTYFEMLDEGNENFLDVYEFPALEPDEPNGVVNFFVSFAEALDFAASTYSASLEKFVPSGKIQDEYLSYLQSKK